MYPRPRLASTPITSALKKQGRKWAFAVGMLAYAVDGALLVAAGDYVSAALHAGILFAIYRRFAALGESAGSESREIAAAASAD